MRKLQTTPPLPTIANATPTPEQARFNTLIGQLATARERKIEWEHHIGLYRDAYLKHQVPLLREARDAQRHWSLALDALVGARRWTRAERDTLVELLLDSVQQLLADHDDPELKAIFARHAESDFDEERAVDLRLMKDVAQRATGLDLGDDEGLACEADLLERLRQAQADAQRAAAEAHAAKARSRRQTKAEKQRAQEAEESSLSVREIFRKLASLLHPDREVDPARRATKTALMQQANQAYAANDLLALLELQLRTEQVDASLLAQLDPSRLKRYNKILAEQLKQLRAETQRATTQFKLEFGLDPGWQPSPKRLHLALAEQTRRLRGAIQQIGEELRMFEHDPVGTRRWVKHQRARLRDGAVFIDDFF